MSYLNHNAVAAKSNSAWPGGVPILPSNVAAIAGKGVTVAVFDSGLDLDAGNGSPHECFRDGGPPGGGPYTFLRLLGSFVVPGSMTVDCTPGAGLVLPAIDCNDPTVQPFTYTGTPPNLVPQKHLDARHGTGVASIILGQQVLATGLADGHAHEASVVSWAITRGYASPSYCNGIRWLTDDAAYASAIQALAAWNIGVSDPKHRARILNISFDGSPDPEHPIQQALDFLATEFNVLVVTLAGNEGDATGSAHGMHNGLSVGATEKRPLSGAPPQPWRFTSRGPLQGDPDRFFPDLCAVGVNVWKPHVDSPQQAPSYATSGSSLAAPQVAGAAALYIARRLGHVAGVSALETRMAILLNVAEMGTTLDTYNNRNAWGVGFLQDHYLCEYAERHQPDPSIQGHLGAVLPLNQEAHLLTPASPAATVPYGPVQGAACVFAIAWNRLAPGTGAPLANLDLEIWNASETTLLARSATLRNSYERIAWKVPAAQQYQTVKIRIVGTQLHGQSVPVYLGARRHPEEPLTAHSVSGTVEVLPQPCTPGGPKTSDNVSRVVPVTYDDSYGSYVFRTAGYPGWALPQVVHTIHQPASLGGGGFTINGFCLRSWAPFNQSGSAMYYDVQFIGLAQTTSNAPTFRPGLYGGGFSTTYTGSSAAVIVSYPGDIYRVNLPAEGGPPVQSARSWREWNLPVPFRYPYTYLPSHADGPNLALWFEIIPPRSILVDAIYDTPPPGPFATAATLTNIDPTPGLTPVLGLVLAGTAAPTLRAYGYPETGQKLILHATNFGANPAGAAVMLIGLGHPTPVPLPPLNCLLRWPDPAQSTSTVLPWIPHAGSCLGGWSMPNDPGLLYKEFFAQVLQVDNGVYPQATNALKVRIGGSYQP
ncbi:MAG: S8 family serine peptidase [Planctomycetes bacterium]|nr:S8 family serine peptidase [Planctomycetota bacterium]